MTLIKNELLNFIQSIRKKNLERKELIFSGWSKDWKFLKYNDSKIINLSSNDYLGLSRHPAVINAAQNAAAKYGAGSGASRLISGTTELHILLEEKIKNFLNQESCLLLGSGYLANIGVIKSFAGKNDIIFSDEFNHASIIDGCKLSGANIKIFEHRNWRHLEKLLEKEKKCTGKKIIVTESTFSMEGTEAPLFQLARLALDHNAILIVDEAHSFGIKGKQGKGLISDLPDNLKCAVTAFIGTLGKAAGSYGAFVCGSTILRKYLINTCRTFIYSTSLPPPVLGASIKAIEIFQNPEGERLRKKLVKNCELIKESLQNMGFKIQNEGPIFYIPVGNSKKATIFEEEMLKEGILLRGIRYPTVPPGTERIRIIVNSSLTANQIEKIKYSLRKVTNKLKLSRIVNKNKIFYSKQALKFS